MARGRAPFLARLLRRRGYRMAPMCVGLPTSTPAFQLAAMYGVRPDIPGFHYYDKRRKSDVYFPRGGDAAHVERTQAAGRRGIVNGGGTYGCVFTGGAASNLMTFAMMKRPTGAGLIRAASNLVVNAWVVVKGSIASTVEVVRALLRMIADPVSVSVGQLEVARDQARNLGVAARALHPGGRPRHLRRRPGDLRQLSRLRRGRPRLGPATPPRPPGSAPRRCLDPSVVAGAQAGAGVWLRPLRVVRSRPGREPALSQGHRRPADRAVALR